MPVIENITIIHILEHAWMETAGYRTERTTISTTQLFWKIKTSSMFPPQLKKL